MHDFDPGIAPDGLFWTVPLPPGSDLKVKGSGETSLVVHNVSIFDYFNIPNALFGPVPRIPATVSFTTHWTKGGKKTKIRDPKVGFAGEFVDNTATMSWSATTSAGTFVSGPESSSASYFSIVGHERNGIFFRQDDE